MEEDLYKVLGVDREASQEEIEKAYRNKAMILHPDYGGDPGKFALVARAKMVLGNVNERARYDRTGDNFRANELELAIRDLVEAAFAQEHMPRDVIRWMKQQVDQARCKAQSERDRMPGKIKRLKQRRDGFLNANAKAKNASGRDALDRALDHHIAKLERQLVELEKTIRIGNAVLAMLTDLKSPAQEGGEQRNPFSSFYDSRPFASGYWGIDD